MDPLHSSLWYRVAALRPRHDPSVRFHRHQVRGEIWYVAQQPSSGRIHRLTPVAHGFLGLLDGERSVAEAWELAAERFGEDAPSQDEALALLGRLHDAELMLCDAAPDLAGLASEFRRAEQGQRRARSPVAFRVPLVDPDAFLSRWQPWARLVFSRAGAAAWCSVVLLAALRMLEHGPELAGAVRTLAEPANWLCLWLAYPLVKGLHELGHAFAVKRFGGEVHEMGILFLVFVPLPYVDASAASLQPEKSRRMLVGAAGVAVELFLASLASFVWIAAEPGLVRQFTCAVMLLGGLSSLLFNGNPLLRYDGYHVLADAIEIPNLAPRANQYVGALARRWLLGLRGTLLPETAPGETPWLIGYAIASFAYRLGVLLAVAIYLAQRFFFVGVALALAALLGAVVLPLLRHAVWLLTDPVPGEQRGRALAGSLGALAVLGALVAGVPLPLHTRSEGVIWLPERSHVRAGADGFVTELLVEPNSFVREGTPLIRTADPSLDARLRVLEAERDELQLRLLALPPEKRVQSEIARERLADAEAELVRARERARAVLMLSPAEGMFVLAGGSEDLLGRRVRQGDVVAYVVDLSEATARVVVPQADVALLRERPGAAWVRLAHDVGTVLPARIVREVPAGTDQLPTRALGTAGGGPFAVDPEDPDGLRTRERVFQFDLSLPEDAALRVAGERVHVRFDHGGEPLIWRAGRAVRRLFLSQLGV